MGILSATLYKWRTKYGGMDTSKIAGLKRLEVQGTRLKKMYDQNVSRPSS